MTQKRARKPSEDTYPRVTLPLAKDTVETIKQMEWAAGFRGAGRTVDSLVEAVADSAEYIEAFVRAGVTSTLLQNSPTPPDAGRVQQLQSLGAIQMINAAVIVDRLRKFVGVDTQDIAGQVKRQLNASAKNAPSGLNHPPPGAEVPKSG